MEEFREQSAQVVHDGTQVVDEWTHCFDRINDRNRHIRRPETGSLDQWMRPADDGV
jgi:hypothetical protein